MGHEHEYIKYFTYMKLIIKHMCFLYSRFFAFCHHYNFKTTIKKIELLFT